MKLRCRLFVIISVLLSLLWQAPLVAETTQLKPPMIQLRDIALVSFNLDVVHIVIDLEVRNPNSVDMVVETILYGLTLNQTHIKYGRIQQQEHFSANSERSVRVPVSLAYDQHLSDILTALSRTTSSSYEISGSVKLQGENTPLLFHHAGPLLLPRLAQSVEGSE